MTTKPSSPSTATATTTTTASSWATVQETPSQKASSIVFTSGSTVVIRAPAEKVFSVITDVERYAEWNEWCPRFEFEASRRHDGGSGGVDALGSIQAGDKAVLHVGMENQGKTYDVPVQILECTSSPTANGVCILSWQGQLMPTWFALSERVQTVTPMGDGSSCEVRNWESMSGWGVYVLDFFLGVKKQLGLSNVKYLQDLKNFAEK